MAKCNNCGKSGLFLVLKDGLCKACFAQKRQGQLVIDIEKKVPQRRTSIFPSNTTISGTKVSINGESIPKEIHLAMKIHSTLCVGVGFGVQHDPLVQETLDACNNDRKSILLKEIELCKDFHNPMAFCTIANAYYFLGAAYRQQTIQYMTKYLKNPDWIPSAEYFDDDKDRYLSGRWGILGQAYEGEYQFEEALHAYQTERDIRPEYPAAYVHIATVLSKMNRLDEAIEFLGKAKTTRYYNEPAFGSCFNTVIDSYLSKFENKKARGYVYRPRHRKS